MSARSHRRRRVPEVIQASVMDCGPAALKSVFEGFDMGIDYAGLREACQVQLDGTSIDTLEAVANEQGLEAEQALIPIDHLWLASPEQLPALTVVVQPDGISHFVVLWSQSGQHVQVMDPARGRRVLTKQALERELYVHNQRVPAAAFRDFAGSDEFSTPLRARLRRLVPNAAQIELLDAAHDDRSWRSFAALDASARAVEQLVQSGGLRRGREAGQLLRHWFDVSRRDPGDSSPEPAQLGSSEAPIPAEYWYAAPSKPQAADARGPALVLSGVVVLRFRRATRPQLSAASDGAHAKRHRAGSQPASVTLARPDKSRQSLPWLVHLLRHEGAAALTLLTLAGVLAAVAALFESVLWRGQLDLDRVLGTSSQRGLAALSILVFMTLLMVLEVGIARATLGIGRRLEARLRMTVMQKVPRLHDRYFQSRSVSDMAERSHMVHGVRLLPGFSIAALRSVCGFIATGFGLIWLDPSGGPRVLIAMLISLLLPLIMQRTLNEQDGRVRAHAATLARFCFDALLGSLMIRAHAGESAVRAEYESQLGEWKRASLKFLQSGVALDLGMGVFSTVLSAWLFLGYVRHVSEPVGALLYLYWALSFPGHGRDIAGLARQLPGFRNVLLRLLEPLNATELQLTAADDNVDQPARAVSVECIGATVQAGGHTLLDAVDLRVAAGEHIAIVGLSGAGKSTLLGLLLGWHRATQGQVRVDGELLSEGRLVALRERTAWVDPAVHLWNRSLYENLRYGSADDGQPLHNALTSAALEDLLVALPDGLQTPLGEAGSRLSGGEGQRVRFARALQRADAGLVVLDEPFRGLDRAARAELLGNARRHWSHSTLLCVTHDVSETLDFARVLVLADGRIVEDGSPRTLAAQAGSRYASMLRAERDLLTNLQSDAGWRRLWLQHGELTEAAAMAPTPISGAGVSEVNQLALGAAE